MKNSARFVGLCVFVLCASPAYGGYQFEKLTGPWVETMPGIDPVLNNQGQVLCLGEEPSYLWLFESGGRTRIGGGPTNGFYAFDMNDDGVVAYSWFGGASGDTFLTRYSAGLYRTLASTISPTIAQVNGAAINNEGTIAASFTVEDPYHATWSTGLYKIDTDNQATVWCDPQLNPFNDWGFGRLSLADTGTAAFSNEYGAYLSPAPDSYIPTAQMDPYGWSWPQASTINSQGQVAYIVWTGEDYPPTPVLVVADGQTPLTQYTPPFTWIENPAINDAGDVAYFASDDETGIAGIYINDDALPVVAVGQEIDGQLVSWLTMCGRGFNDLGQILFRAEFSDSSSALYLATPVPGMPGDFSGDGLVNTEDINPFILALTGGSPPVNPLDADPNGDGAINTEDINVLIALLTGGGQAGIIPEPGSAATMLLLAAGCAIARGGTRRRGR